MCVQPRHEVVTKLLRSWYGVDEVASKLLQRDCEDDTQLIHQWPTHGSRKSFHSCHISLMHSSLNVNSGIDSWKYPSVHRIPFRCLHTIVNVCLPKRTVQYVVACSAPHGCYRTDSIMSTYCRKTCMHDLHICEWEIDEHLVTLSPCSQPAASQPASQQPASQPASQPALWEGLLNG